MRQKDPAKLDMLRAGQVPIYEPGLQELMARNMESGRLHFSSDLPAAVSEADAVFIAVGTPARRGDGHADLTYVFAAAEEFAGEYVAVLEDRLHELRYPDLPPPTPEEVWFA